jgi:UDP-2,3-diacylglucosamine pyrophosphatase LpxH
MVENKKVIILGDTHLGIKSFSIDFFYKTQLKFFKEQLIPYMLKNNIDTIFQLGDFLDNRTTMDIRLWEIIKKELFDNLILKHNIKIITILGNHDISYRNTLEVNFMNTIRDLYPNNIQLIDKPTMIDFNSQKCLFQPWLLPDEKIDMSMLSTADYILGHFETTGFLMVKGHACENGLNPDNFKLSNIKKVYSGHFHIKSHKGKIHYVGTPYALNWGDYNLDNGFIVFDTNKDKFIKNKVSQKFVKLKYNDTIHEDKPLEVSGLYATKKYYDKETIPFKDLKNHIVKFFINKAKTSDFEDYIYLLKQADIEFEVLNNQEISLLIGTDYNDNEVDDVSTKEFILQSIKDTELKELVLDIIQEVKDNEKDED